MGSSFFGSNLKPIIPPGIFGPHWDSQCDRFCVGNISIFFHPTNVFQRGSICTPDEAHFD